MQLRLVYPELSIERHRRGTSPKLPISEQDAVVERVVYTDELTARDRAAAILVIVFGQHIEDVIQLTWDKVTVTDDVVTVKLGKTEFGLRLSSCRRRDRLLGGEPKTTPQVEFMMHKLVLCAS